MGAYGHPFRKIVVASDFSETAAVALGHAVRLADQYRAEVGVVHVIPSAAVSWAVEATSFEFHWRIPPADLKRAERKLRREAEERLAQAVAPYSSAQRKLRAEVRVGEPFVEIIRAAARQRADLVVAGTRGLSTVKRLLVGSTAERLVRKCPRPVWVVKPDHHDLPRSILVPVDFSEVSGHSLELAAGLASTLDCSLHVLHVLSATAEFVQVPESAADLDIRQQRRTIRQAAAQHLDKFVARHVPEQVAVWPLLGVGVPWHRIGAVARRLDVDVIVMGSVGRTGIPGLLIGNTAEKVLRHSDRSILAVKPAGFVSPVDEGARAGGE